MTDWYLAIKNFYDRELWDITRVRNAVLKEKITEEQFTEITGESI